MSELKPWIEKQRIHELCARYTLTLDGHDVEGWAGCFTPDGVFGFGDHGLVGREAIAAYGQVHAGLGARHVNTSLLFEIDPSGERATGQSAVVMTVATKKGYRVAFLGRYEDEVVLVDGEWLFSRRWVVADPFPGDPTLDLLSADPDLVALIQPLLDAYERLGTPVARGT